MLAAPRLRSACCVGATTEKGTDWRFSSRLRAVTVTVTSSVKRGGSSASAMAGSACPACSSASACCAEAGNGSITNRAPSAQNRLFMREKPSAIPVPLL